jgi:chromosome segregation protein
MKVARIEVFGFKSFMERLLLPLEGGITGVVGPNGCGKSNVVDALRWVLGETRASQLRGGTLEDVIFNGTDSLRPLGLAEVTITLRADGNALLDDLVSPQVEAELVASGELEQGELTQEEERPRLTVIRGGALGERGDEDGLKLEDNLGIAEGGQETFDDAQEILDDSEQGLEVLDESGSQDEMPTKTNEKRRSASLISRFHWLASVSEVQVTRRFYRSGESEFFINKVQCRLKDLKDLFRAVGLGARAYTIVAQGEVGRIVTAKPADRRMILEEAAGVVGFRDKIAEATRRLADTSQNILRLQDVIGELERQVGILKRQASRARARQEIKEELIEAERTLFLDIYSSLQEREDEVAQGQEIGREAEERVGERFADLAVAEGSSRQELETIELRIDELRSRLERMREESLRRERTLTERKAKGEELRKLIQSTTNEMLRLSERCAVIAERKAKSSAHITDLEQQDEELGGQVQQSDEDGGAEIDDVAAELEEARTELAATEQQLRQVRDEFIAKESVLQAIREQIAAASPSQQLARVFGAELAGETTETLRLLLDEMHVPEQYGRAAQAIIAERARFLLVDDPLSVGARFLNRITSAGEGGIGGAIGVLRAGAYRSEQKGMYEVRTPFPRLIDLISVSDSAEGIVRELLERVVVADSLNDAIAFFASEESGDARDCTVVTLNGDVLTKNSFFGSGGDSGLIELRGRELVLSGETAALAHSQDNLIGERVRLSEKVANLDVRYSETLRVVRERQRIVRELGLQQGNVRGLLQAERAILEQLDQDGQRAQEQVEELQSHADDLRHEAAVVEEDIEALEALVDDADDEDGEVVVAELSCADQERRNHREVLARVSEELMQVRSELDRTRAANARFEIELQKIQVERQSVCERFIAEQGTEEFQRLAEMGAPEERLSADDKQQLQGRVTQLRNRIVREGEVDPSSIEQYEAEKERLDGIVGQKEDLERAATTLKESLQRLTATSEERFLATFQAVRRNFSRLVPSLFGGGAADLSLSDPTKPLESGVDISVRPPGKKLKSIDLMSGGEKALCATALIFAMFLERPSPLCVLDEVDAPLDEANLQRFLKVIREMSASTQFLMITHNKASMAAADTLVGVTMPTPGASKLITVSLKEAVVHGN